MSCSPFDLRDYFLQELPDPERRQVEVHLKTCAACQEDLERLRLTGAALASLPDEEIPQRLAFISDKIFEPSPWARAWASFWGSAARLGFASAAMVSAALIIFTVAGATRKGGDPQQIQAAVDRAVAASEIRLERRISDIAREVDYSRRQQLMFERSAYYGERQ